MAYTSYFLTRFVFAKWTIGGFCQRVWVKTTWQRAERVLSSPWSWLAEPGLQKSPFSEPSLGHGGSAGRLPVPQVLPCLKNSYPLIFDNLQTMHDMLTALTAMIDGLACFCVWAPSVCQSIFTVFIWFSYRNRRNVIYKNSTHLLPPPLQIDTYSPLPRVCYFFFFCKLLAFKLQC